MGKSSEKQQKSYHVKKKVELNAGFLEEGDVWVQCQKHRNGLNKVSYQPRVCDLGSNFEGPDFRTPTNALDSNTLLILVKNHLCFICNDLVVSNILVEYVTI